MENIKGFTTSHLNDELFKEILKGINQKALFKSWTQLNLIGEGGFVTKAVQSSEIQEKRILGLSLFQIEYLLPDSSELYMKKIMIKSKSTGKEVVKSFIKLIPESENDFIHLFKESIPLLGLNDSEYRELACVQCDDPYFRAVMPEIYWSKVDPDYDIFVFAMEYFDQENVTHLDTIRNIDLWQENDVLDVLDGLATIHSRFYKETNKIPPTVRKCTTYKERLNTLCPLWKMCSERNLKIGVWSKDDYELAVKLLCHLPEISEVLDASVKTINHYDVNSMNLCLRKNFRDKPRLCLYDWEFSCIGPPVYDVAYFIPFVLQPNTDIKKWDHYRETYISLLKKHLNSTGKITNVQIQTTVQDFIDFEKVFDMSICEIFISRYSWFFAIFVAAYQPDFASRVKNNLVKYLSHVVQKYNFV